MAIRDSVLGFLYELVELGFIQSHQYKSYLRRPNQKNLRKIIESQFTLSIPEIKEFVYKIFDSWETDNDCWKDIEIVILRYLLRCNGTATISELVKKSGIDIDKIRKAIKDLEEDEGLIKTINYNGNTKLIFLNQEYVRKKLK